MITPRFSLNQDSKYLIINIRAPYCDLKELEIYVENDDFRFVCAPYYLRLKLPGNIIDNDECSGQYKHEDGEFHLKYMKETPGETFEGLDFITSLLTSKKSKKSTKTPEIEVITSDGDEWSINQSIPEENDAKLITGHKYGFANQKCDVLRRFEDEFYSVFDVRGVDGMSPDERKLLKTDTEAMDFNVDHFIADYFDDAAIKEMIGRTLPWLQLNDVRFSDEDKDFLKDLPNREYLLTTDELNSVLLGLMDILFCYCYDKRTTEFESNCESGWTLTKLSSTLCWFYIYDNERDLLVSNYRRTLIYPLYRNFDLAAQTHKDLIVLLNLGPIFIVKCLIDIYNIFNGSADPRYILNDLYIKDYIIFMQKCPKQQLNNVINNITAVQIAEKDVNLNLRKLIEDQLGETNAGNSILEKMAKMNISRIESDSDSEDSESDSSESESSSDGSTSDTNESSSESEENT